MSHILIPPPCLLQSRNQGAIVTIPFCFNADDWRMATLAFADACGRRHPLMCHVSTWTLYHDQTHFGIPYSWGLAGPAGSWFVVHRLPEHDGENVQKCIDKIRAEQDVVSLRVEHVTKSVKFELPKAAVTMP